MSWSGFGSLDLSTVEAEQGRKTLPPGNHECRISAAEIKKTKSGHGLRVDFEALDGSGSVNELINLNNLNPEAERIGKQRLKALLLAAKHPSPDRPGDVRSLVNLRVGVHVEQGPEWIDKTGNKRPGGGQPRRSGAYYEIEGSAAGAGFPSSGAFDSPGSGDGFGYGTDDLDDEIPF